MGFLNLCHRRFELALVYENFLTCYQTQGTSINTNEFPTCVEVRINFNTGRQDALPDTGITQQQRLTLVVSFTARVGVNVLSGLPDRASVFKTSPDLLNRRPRPENPEKTFTWIPKEFSDFKSVVWIIRFEASRPCTENIKNNFSNYMPIRFPLHNDGQPAYHKYSLNISTEFETIVFETTRIK